MLGVAIFATGVVAVFTTENGPGAAALLAIGAAFAAVAALDDRIESLQLAGVNLTLREIARQTFARADEAERRGDEAAADQLRVAASALQALAREYRRIRGSMKAGDRRTTVLEDVLNRTRALTDSGAFNANDVAEWFDHGTPEARITALALMQADPELRDFSAAVTAISRPASAFEQWHGLRLAELMYDDLTYGQRVELTDVLERVRPRLPSDHDRGRHDLAGRLLTALGHNERA
jgi:hypothetical protein